DVADLALRAFLHHEDKIGAATFARLEPVGYGDIRIAVALVVGFDVAAALQDFSVAERTAGGEFAFAGELLVAEDRVADKADSAQRRAGRNFRDQAYAAVHFFGKEADVIDQAAFIQSLDVVIQPLGAVFLPRAGGHEIAQPRLIHRALAAVL